MEKSKEEIANKAFELAEGYEKECTGCAQYNNAIIETEKNNEQFRNLYNISKLRHLLYTMVLKETISSIFFP